MTGCGSGYCACKGGGALGVNLCTEVFLVWHYNAAWMDSGVTAFEGLESERALEWRVRECEGKRALNL